MTDRQLNETEMSASRPTHDEGIGTRRPWQTPAFERLSVAESAAGAIAGSDGGGLTNTMA